jgi:hypothetical protein
MAVDTMALPTPRMYVHALAEQGALLIAWQREQLAAITTGSTERELTAMLGISRCEAYLAILRAKLYLVSRL